MKLLHEIINAKDKINESILVFQILFVVVGFTSSEILNLISW